MISKRGRKVLRRVAPGPMMAAALVALGAWVIALGATAGWLAAHLSADGELAPATVAHLTQLRWIALLGGMGLWVWIARRARRLLTTVLIALSCWLAAVVFLQRHYPRHLLFEPRQLARAVLDPELRLFDFDPHTALVVTETPVLRARFPAINIHAHFLSGEQQRSAQEMLAIMQATNVAATVDLDATEDRVADHLARFYAVAPERFFIFQHVWFGKELTDWPAFYRTVAGLEAAKARGIKGIKIWKLLGLVTVDEHGTRVAIDDPRLDPLWETAGRLHLPVLIHISDPPAFFHPIDAHNERYEELTYSSPDWTWSDPKYPRPPALVAEFERVLARHPKTVFIGAHMVSLSHDLGGVGRLLEAHPNLYVDTAAVGNELGRQPVTARAFFLRYPDRILFGTDGNVDEARYRGYFRLFETADEYFPHPARPGYRAGRWKIYGLQLPEEVLRKFYYDNAARLLGLPRL